MSEENKFTDNSGSVQSHDRRNMVSSLVSMKIGRNKTGLHGRCLNGLDLYDVTGS